eukprot:5020704-Pyramimonas_sp.AAC.1
MYGVKCAQGDETVDGAKVPCGKPIKNEQVVEQGGDLVYNEYVVYDTSQVRLRYVLKVKFDFK